jgi:hypothetical protein
MTVIDEILSGYEVLRPGQEALIAAALAWLAP